MEFVELEGALKGVVLYNRNFNSIYNVALFFYDKQNRKCQRII